MKTKYPDKIAVMKRAQELVDACISFGSLDGYERLSKTNKGDLGQIIEESWFEYKPNSDKDPDFKEAGVELKVSPYKHTRNGVSAKERLVCDIINYVEEAEKNSFEDSAFWHKCKCICLLSYLWREGIPKEDLFVDHATLLDEYPEEDLLIIKHDWKIIIDKIRAGEAHLITEGDTMYLAACTKGESSATVREQPYSKIPAKQRAYSLKTTYMTHLLRKYVFGEEEDEHVIKDYRLLEKLSFDDIVTKMFEPYIGYTTLEIARALGIVVKDTKAKNLNAVVTQRILGIIGNPDRAEEFRNANITVKTIVVGSDDKPEQNMSFPEFSFTDIISQEWEDSDVYSQMAASRFLFVVFQRDNKNYSPILRDVFFWNMPAEDIEKLQSVWEKTRQEIRNGVVLTLRNGKIYNSLPNQTDSCVAHVRPHTAHAAYVLDDGTVIGDPKHDANPLPDGRWMTKQCFWFNKGYIQAVINKHSERPSYTSDNSYQIAAEKPATYGNVGKDEIK
ncbi:MAG: restriction endonuclease [Oscillospiraceae bacterium]|nr:restriction endonuclease [Oscillospiraceae bacterium]